MTFDKDRAVDLINDFLRSWATQLGEIGKRACGVFESFSTMLIMLGLKRNRFKIRAHNLRNGVFVVKRSTQGDPNKYSFFTAQRDSESYEIRQNQDVRGCHQGFYKINEDIVIMEQDSLGGRSVSHNKVVAFASCKHLPCFPSLIADFIGEVHELQYSRLQSSIVRQHPAALLLTSGSITKGGQNLIDSIQRLRGYNVMIFGGLSPSYQNRSIRQFLGAWQI